MATSALLLLVCVMMLACNSGNTSCERAWSPVVYISKQLIDTADIPQTNLKTNLLSLLSDVKQTISNYTLHPETSLRNPINQTFFKGDLSHVSQPKGFAPFQRSFPSDRSTQNASCNFSKASGHSKALSKTTEWAASVSCGSGALGFGKTANHWETKRNKARKAGFFRKKSHFCNRDVDLGYMTSEKGGHLYDSIGPLTKLPFSPDFWASAPGGCQEENSSAASLELPRCIGNEDKAIRQKKHPNISQYVKYFSFAFSS